MKYWTCPCCGKRLIRLTNKTTYPRHYSYWCDNCNIDINIIDNEDKLLKSYERRTERLNRGGDVL